MGRDRSRLPAVAQVGTAGHHPLRNHRHTRRANDLAGHPGQPSQPPLSRGVLPYWTLMRQHARNSTDGTWRGVGAFALIVLINDLSVDDVDDADVFVRVRIRNRVGFRLDPVAVAQKPLAV